MTPSCSSAAISTADNPSLVAAPLTAVAIGVRLNLMVARSLEQELTLTAVAIGVRLNLMVARSLE
jgi:hypothetical protein